jgi:hypothetical protein
MPELEIPIRPFFYTIDQVASIMQLPISSIRGMTYFTGRTNRVRESYKLTAINIALPADKPDWRIEEQEFLRWLKVMGYKPKRRPSLR